MSRQQLLSPSSAALTDKVGDQASFGTPSRARASFWAASMPLISAGSEIGLVIGLAVAVAPALVSPPPTGGLALLPCANAKSPGEPSNTSVASKLKIVRFIASASSRHRREYVQLFAFARTTKAMRELRVNKG
jgi:hypothetical protein